MTESILTSIKKLLGIDESYQVFDLDLITHINSAFAILHQLGVGPANGFEIYDDTAVWEDYLGSTSKNLNMVRSYIALRVRLMFDPPTSSALIEAIKQQISELEFRLNIEVDPAK